MCKKDRSGIEHTSPGATAEAIDPARWMNTGDLATLDEQGMDATMDDRVCASARGGDCGPARALWERRYAGSQEESSIGFAQCRGLSSVSSVALTVHPSVRAEIQRHVDAVNERLSGAEQITAFTILPTEWSVAGGELTPTLKLKRSVITRKYADAIEATYA